MRLFVLVFSYWCFAFSGFAYDIEPYYLGKSPSTDKGETFNLIFCSLNYSDKAVFLKDIGMLIQSLKRTMPFDEFIQKITFYYVILSKEEENTLFKPTSGFPPLKARRDFLEGILAKLKSSYKLVILDAQISVSCAELSSADKMSLIILGKRRYNNSNSFAKGFLHELGHSLGLRDERIEGAHFSSPGPPNCASTKQEAKEWWGDLAGKEPRVNYIPGCSGNKRYIRPTIASLMNDPEKAEDFGPVNQRYLKQILAPLISK